MLIQPEGRLQFCNILPLFDVTRRMKDLKYLGVKGKINEILTQVCFLYHKLKT